MKRLLLLLPVLIAGAALLGRPGASAHPFTPGFDLGVAGTPNVGNPITTLITVELGNPSGPHSNGEPFLDASITTFTGIDVKTNVPVGDQIGSNTFSMYVSFTGPPCNDLGALLNPTFTIYNGHVHGVHDGGGHSWPGYANGIAYDLAHWIADFDDDDENNVPDSTQSPNPGDSVAESIEDADSDGVPNGAEGTVEPLFIPVLDAVIGSVHDVRGLGNAVIFGGVQEVPVDFVTYKDFPAAGTTSTIAVIGSGAGLGLLPANPATATIVTCPPFSTTVTNFGTSSGGQVAQEVTGPVTFTYTFSVAADWDGDGVAQYNDNCDAVPNPWQEDTDGDGIGNACDTGFVVPGAPLDDVDKDGFKNSVDSCPESASTNDTDDDGVADGCDPDDRVEGNGDGYAIPSPGVYHDHEGVWTDSYTPGTSEPTGDAVFTPTVDADDDGTPDASDSGDSDNDGVADSADSDPLDRQGVPEPSNRATTCSTAGPDCDFDSLFPFYYGDGCLDSSEAGKGLNSSSPWDFYSVPVPALFAPTAPKSTLPNGVVIVNAFRDAVVGTGDAQAVFGYFKAGAKANAPVYENDLNGNGVKDGWEYDRTILGPGITQVGPPDGSVTVQDAQKAFAQFKVNLKCSPDPFYNMND